MKKRLPFGSLVVGALALVCARPAIATVADDLCGALDDPCVVTGKVVVDPSSTLDFGTRTFRIAEKAKLTWRDDLTIHAGACEFQPKSQVVEDKTSTGTGFLELNCDSTSLLGKIKTKGSGVLAEGDGPHEWGGLISVKGDTLSVIAIDSYGLPGNITLSGKIIAIAKVGAPPGEVRFISNFGNIEVGEKAKMQVKGVESDPSSEIIWFEAGSGTLDIRGKIQAKTKTGAYQMAFEADGNVTVHPKSKIQCKGKGNGAEVGFNSQSGSVTIFGKVQVPAKEPSDGPKIRICAAADATVEEKGFLDASDKSSDGSVIIGAGDVARIQAGAKVFAKHDGDIEVCGGTSGSVSSQAKVDPPPEETGMTGECLSPNSQFIFFLDCNQ